MFRAQSTTPRSAISQARRQMDGVLIDVRRGVRVLADLGIQSIVLVADHGHVFTEEISDDMKIDAPGGDTADLQRRVWVGVGGGPRAILSADFPIVARRRK